ncbi:unnamed protein product [Mesocestoides corti]|uniref:Dynein light intermediate chain n=1 Tax=Mesocestoides corti TaxID=53468 RepID=A0A0R3ULR0_MESCO|nr:unnamed protein product [Mesocestoides corti]
MGLEPEVQLSDSNEDQIRLWSSLLKEVANARIGKLPQKKGLVILGDSGCGKSTLACRLSHKTLPPKSPAIEYHFVDIRDEATDDQTKLSVWILDGELEFIPFLKFPLDKKSFADRMVIIAVDMERPWDIMEQLKKWASALDTYIKSIDISVEDMDEYKENLVRHFRGYVEPDSLNLHTTSAGETAVPKTDAPVLAQTSGSAVVGHSLHPATAALLGLNAQRVQQSSVPMDHETEEAEDGGQNEEEAMMKKKAATSALAELPITPGALVNNLGIPIVVVVTKTDVMDNLERDHGISEEQFDLIQMHIRRFCLSYGASLIYVSAKNGKNCGLLSSYLQHRIYGFPFTQNAYVIDKDSVFIPAGWDSLNKISLLEQNLTKYRPGDEFTVVIPRPEKASATVNTEPEVCAMDEQRFLSRLYTNLQRDATSASANENSPTAHDQSTLDSSATPGSRPSSASSQAAAQRSRSSGAGNTSGLAGNASEKVLASFFNNLLSKGSSARQSPNTSFVLPADTSGTSEAPILTNKEMQSELERLARTSKEALDTSGDNAASPRKS